MRYGGGGVIRHPPPGVEVIPSKHWPNESSPGAIGGQAWTKAAIGNIGPRIAVVVGYSIYVVCRLGWAGDDGVDWLEVGLPMKTARWAVSLFDTVYSSPDSSWVR